MLVHGALHWRRLRSAGLGRWVPVARRGTGYRGTPTAWDHAAPSRGGRFVRIRIGPGRWVGGWFGNDSYVSTYPEPPDIFLESQWAVDTEGQIGERVAKTAGVWLRLRDGDIVEWVDP
jgi:hypothetical protein